MNIVTKTSELFVYIEADFILASRQTLINALPIKEILKLELCQLV